MKRAKPKDREGPIDLAIGDWLFYNKFCYTKLNTRGYFRPAGKKQKNGFMVGSFRKDINPHAKKGIPDYGVLLLGYFLGLEIKSPTGVQSDDQKEFQKYITEKGGAEYHVVRSLDQAIEVVTAWRQKILAPKS